MLNRSLWAFSLHFFNHQCKKKKNLKIAKLLLSFYCSQDRRTRKRLLVFNLTIQILLFNGQCVALSPAKDTFNITIISDILSNLVSDITTNIISDILVDTVCMWYLWLFCWFGYVPGCTNQCVKCTMMLLPF